MGTAILKGVLGNDDIFCGYCLYEGKFIFVLLFIQLVLKDGSYEIL